MSNTYVFGGACLNVDELRGVEGEGVGEVGLDVGEEELEGGFDGGEVVGVGFEVEIEAVEGAAVGAVDEAVVKEDVELVPGQEGLGESVIE